MFPSSDLSFRFCRPEPCAVGRTLEPRYQLLHVLDDLSHDGARLVVDTIAHRSHHSDLWCSVWVV